MYLVCRVDAIFSDERKILAASKLILKLRQSRSQALVSSLPSPGASGRETREEDGALERDWNEYKVRSTGGCKDRLSAYFREDDHEVSYFLHHSSNRNITVT